jgi:hypothetical protein
LSFKGYQQLDLGRGGRAFANALPADEAQFRAMGVEQGEVFDQQTEAFDRVAALGLRCLGTARSSAIVYSRMRISMS